MTTQLIPADKLSYDYLLELTETLDSKGFSKDKKLQEALLYVCERAAWLDKNQHNIYMKVDTEDEKGKLVKVNIKTK